MKIWFLTSEFPPEYGGGIGMYVDQVSKMFSNVGHNITVFTRNNEKTYIEKINDNLKYIRFQHCNSPIYSTLGYWAALSYQFADEVVKQLENETPDIIEVQEYGAIGYYLLMKKLLGHPILRNIPIVVHLHTPVFELSRINQSPRFKFPNYWTGQMEIFCMKAADSLLCPSEFLKNEIQKYAPNNPITVINLPYIVENISNYPNRNINSKTILYGGRTEYRKGIYQALKIFEELWEDDYYIKLRIFGGDTLFHPKNIMLGNWIKNKYKKWIDKGLLELNSPIPPNKLDLEMLNSMAVIVPSIYENFPYACVTAMWLGCPMIVSKQGGQAEMVAEDGKNGFIFDWEKNNLKEKLIELIEKSPEELEQIGKNGQNRIKHLCNIEKNLNLRLQYFNKVIENYHVPNKFPFMNENIDKKPYKYNSEEGIKGLLSIIIPYYNLGKYILETLKSALESEYKNKEIIIVNDGSNEPPSLEILEKIKIDHPEIEILNISNAGLANARNVGAKAARGEWITFLDSDDLVDQTFYSKAINILQQYNNISFVYSWVEYFENGSGIWPTFPTEFPYLLCSNMLSAFCVVRRSDYINFGQNRSVMEYGMEDFDGWLNLCANGYFGVSIPEPLVKYRIRSDSMSRQFNPDMRLYLLDKLSENKQEIFQKFSLEIYNLLLENGPSYFWNNPTWEMPPIGFLNNSDSSQSFSPIASGDKFELMRIANSSFGSKLIKLMFKLKLNKLFK